MSGVIRASTAILGHGPLPEPPKPTGGAAKPVPAIRAATAKLGHAPLPPVTTETGA
jgi:hypothetical protein